MASAVKSSGLESGDPTPGGAKIVPAPISASADWLRVGTIAAASAVLGGLAAAWFYRKALRQLREAENHIPDSLSKPIADGTEEDF